MGKQERLKRFEKENRRLFLFGIVSLALVVVSWIIFGLAGNKISELILRPGQTERLMMQRIEREFAPQNQREETLLTVTKMFMTMPLVIIKVFVIRTIQILLFTTGLMCIGFARSQKKLIEIAKNS